MWFSSNKTRNSNTVHNINSHRSHNAYDKILQMKRCISIVPPCNSRCMRFPRRGKLIPRLRKVAKTSVRVGRSDTKPENCEQWTTAERTRESIAASSVDDLSRRVHREVTVTYCSGIYRRNCRAGKQVQGKEGEQRRENCSLHCLITSDSKVNELVSRTELITINATASRLTDVRCNCRHGGYIGDFATPCSSQLNKQDI